MRAGLDGDYAHAIQPSLITPETSSRLQDFSIRQVYEACFGDFEPEIECSRANLIALWKNQVMPSHWIREDFKESNSGVDVPCFRSDAKNPWLEARFAIGFNAIPMAYIRQIAALNAMGINVVIMMSPLIDRSNDFTQLYEDANLQFATDDNLPIDRNADRTVPRIWADHSMNSHSTLRNTLINGHEKAYDERYIGALHMAPFLAIAYANKEFYPKRNRLLHYQASGDNLTKLANETFWGRRYTGYSRLMGEPKIFSSIADPTFEQMLVSEEWTTPTTDQLRGQKPEIIMPRLFIIPENDSVACHKMMDSVATSLGIPTYKTDDWHVPLLENPLRSITNFVSFADQMLTQHEQKMALLAQQQRELPLSSRLPDSLQSLAGLLNTATGLAQGFFRGRVGNAEMRETSQRPHHERTPHPSDSK